jgi:hypothetical protein
MFHDFPRPRGALLLCLPLIALACAGCIPEEQWLDDSSGFLENWSALPYRTLTQVLYSQPGPRPSH